MKKIPMTNYNEKFDEVFRSAFYRIRTRIMRDAEIYPSHIVQAEVELKQALTSLIKELVAEAKPDRAVIHYDELGIDRARKSAANSALDRFEQNLLKALEEIVWAKH